MRKSIILIIILAIANIAVKAQNASATGSQQVQLVLSNVIDITFTSTNTNTGAAVNLPFNTVADYANGVTSPAQTIKVRSNLPFNVTVKSNANNFSYAGSYTTGTTMPVNSVLKVMVSANTTGGSIAAPFNGFSPVTSSNQNLIVNGTNGGDQQFSVQYKATPGMSYPAGTYTTTVVYTATQQ